MDNCGIQTDNFSMNGCGVQTDIAQFQVEEIMLKLQELQNQVRTHINFQTNNNDYK